MCGLFRCRAKLLFENSRQLRKHVFRCDLSLFEHVVELRGGDAHCLGRKVERSRQPFAQLPAQFFGLHLALADHLAEREEHAVHLIRGQGKRGPCLRHTFKDIVQVFL